MIKFKKMNISLTQMECSREQLMSIRARFTSIDPRARYIIHGNGEICPISTMGNFATPLLLEIASGAKSLFPEEEIEIDSELIPIFKPDLSKCRIVQPSNQEIKLRPYQEEAVFKMLKFGRGILKVPTRGGKSLILYSVVSSIFQYMKDIKTAFLMVPNTQLINQMFNDFHNYGVEERFEVIKFSSKDREPPAENSELKRIIISNRQWLQEHLDQLPKKIDVVFVDECHTCSVGGFASKFTKMFKTNYKFGMTATDSDDMKNVWNTRKLFGPVIYEVPFEVLEENGFVAKPQIIPIEVFFKSNVGFFQDENPEIEFGDDGLPLNAENRQENGYILESQFLAQSEDFNKIIAELAKAVSKEGNVLILFDRTMHGKILFDRIISDNKFYIDGSTKLEERMMITEKLQKNIHSVLIAQSATMGVGLTMKSLNSVFLVNLKSASTATLQGIGRGLMVEEGKNQLRIFDIYASGIGRNFKYSKKHRKNRKNLLTDYYKCKEENTRTITID